MGVGYMDKLNTSIKSEIESDLEHTSYLYNLYYGVEKPDFSQYVEDWTRI